MMMEQESHHQANNNDASQGVSAPLFHHIFVYSWVSRACTVANCVAFEMGGGFRPCKPVRLI